MGNDNERRLADEVTRLSRERGDALAAQAVATTMLGDALKERDEIAAKFSATHQMLSIKLDQMTRERDALVAGKWLSAWVTGSSGDAERNYIHGSLVAGRAFRSGTLWTWWAASRKGRCATEQEAKDAADSALRDAGWWLGVGCPPRPRNPEAKKAEKRPKRSVRA